MNQNIWGNQAWFMLHCITFNYPIKPTEIDKERHLNFFKSLEHVLPCGYCRKNYKRNLNELPIRLDSRKDIVMWLIDVHNEVNAKEGKRQYSYDEVREIYEKLLNKKLLLEEDNNPIGKKCTHTVLDYLKLNKEYFYWLIILILILYIIFIKN